MQCNLRTITNHLFRRRGSRFAPFKYLISPSPQADHCCLRLTQKPGSPSVYVYQIARAATRSLSEINIRIT